MLMDTLDDFENTKMYDENLKPLIDMWKGQKAEVYKKYGVSTALQDAQGNRDRKRGSKANTEA